MMYDSVVLILISLFNVKIPHCMPHFTSKWGIVFWFRPDSNHGYWDDAFQKKAKVVILLITN